MERNDERMEQESFSAWNSRRRRCGYNSQAQENERLAVVLDTNILVSASFWNGDSATIVSLATANKIKCFTSIELIDEFKRVVLRDFDIPEQSFNSRLGDLLKIAEIIQPTQRVFACEDKDDDKVLEAALEAKVDYIVSVDKHLLKMKEFQSVKIVTAFEFLKIFASNKV